MARFWGYLSLLLGSLVLLVFFLGALDVVSYATFAPWKEEVRRETYEESRTHVQGTIEELYRLKLEYEQNPEHRSSLRSIALREVRGLEKDEIPRELRSWLDTLRTNDR